MKCWEHLIVIIGTVLLVFLAAGVFAIVLSFVFAFLGI